MTEDGNVVIHLTMTDGSVWAFPAHVVADHRARYYAESDPDTTYEKEYEHTISSDFELRDWAGNNMDWDDVAEHARQVAPPPEPDFQESWLTGPMTVVRPTGA